MSLGNRYGRDGARVFFENKAVRGADPATWFYLGNGYSLDKRSVYFEEKPVKGSDPSTFHCLPPYGYHCAIDSTGIYFMGERMSSEAYAQILEQHSAGLLRDREKILSGELVANHRKGYRLDT